MIDVSRGDLALSALAFSIASIGAAALVVAAWWRRGGDSLTWFGVFSVLYGTRVALGLPIVSLVPHLSREALVILRFDVTYLLPLPLMLLVRDFVGAGWRQSMRI